MRWKTEPSNVELERESLDARERLRAELEARGVASVTAEELAEQVFRELGSEAAASTELLDGLALGVRAQHAVGEALTKSAADLQEIERLMGSFASELSKLDEVLEVLAAHLRRMRTSAPSAATRTVH